METIHTDQTGAFPVTGNGEMINAYQKMVNWMEIAGLGLKYHRLDKWCSKKFKKCIQNGMVQAWVAHFVTPLKFTYDEYD